MTYRRGANRIPQISALTLTLFLAIGVGMMLPVAPASALDDGGGRSVFATGAGNRALAMGGAYTAVADDASASVWNPAGLGLIPRKELQATQTSLFGLGFNEQYASIALPNWRWGTVALTWRHFGVDGIESRDERGFLLSDNLEDTETELALGYGRLFGNGHLALGGTVKVQNHKLAGYSGSGLGADLGFWAQPLHLLGVERFAHALSCGVSLRNALEPKIKLDQDNVPDPMVLRSGLAWSQEIGDNLDLLLATDLERSPDMDSRIHVGAECRVLGALAVRAGVADGMLTAGAGFRLRGISTDYQYENNELGDIHRFGLTVGFGLTVTENRDAARDAQEAAIRERLEQAFSSRNRTREQNIADKLSDDLDARRWEDALNGVGTLAVLAPQRDDLGRLEAAAWRGVAADQEAADDLAAAALSYRRALAVLPTDTRSVAGLQRVQTESERRSARGREIKDHFEAAMDAFARGDLLAARDGFAKVTELAPGDDDAAIMLTHTHQAITRRASALAESALTLVQAGQLDGARSRVAEARTLDATAPGIDTAEAAIRGAEQRLASAVVRSESVSRSMPRPTSTIPVALAAPLISEHRRQELDEMYQRGLAAMQDGRRSDAVRYWEIVWSADADHAQVREHLTQEYLARGMEAYADGGLRNAVSNWEQAVRVAPDDPRARGYLERAHNQLARMQKISSHR